MAYRTVTAEEIIDRALQRTDWEGERSADVGQFLFSNQELLNWATEELGTLHGMMVKLNESWFRTEIQLSLTGSLYQVPNDCYNVKGFDKLFDGEPIPLQEQTWESREASYLNGTLINRGYLELPTWTWDGQIIRFAPHTITPGDLTFTYIQSSPILDSLTDEIGWPYTINAWESYVVLGLCIRMKQKQDMEWQQHKVEQDGVKQAIEKAASDRVQTGMRTVVDMLDSNVPFGWFWSR